MLSPITQISIVRIEFEATQVCVIVNRRFIQSDDLRLSREANSTHLRKHARMKKGSRLEQERSVLLAAVRSKSLVEVK